MGTGRRGQQGSNSETIPLYEAREHRPTASGLPAASCKAASARPGLPGTAAPRPAPRDKEPPVPSLVAADCPGLRSERPRLRSSQMHRTPPQPEPICVLCGVAMCQSSDAHRDCGPTGVASLDSPGEISKIKIFLMHPFPEPSGNVHWA